jgi:hypothetical protein
MNVKYLLFLILISFSVRSFSQQIPDTYYLHEKGDKKTYKTSAENPLGNGISDILTIGDTVWLGTGKGVSVSFDRGENWTNFYGTEPFGNVDISAIAYNKYDGSVWVATSQDVEVSGGEILPEGRGYRYTTDGGLSWSTLVQPIDDPGDSLLVYGINDGVNLPRVRALPVTTGINNLTYDVAFTKGVIWTASFAGGLRKSTDNGQTWQRALLPSDELDEISPDDTIKYALQPVAGNFGSDDHLNHRLFSVISVNDTTLYVGTANGINKSNDNGISWAKFNHQNQDNPISGNFVVALGYNQIDNTVWGATWRAENPEEFYAVSATNDGGENWNVFLDGEKAHNFGFIFNNIIAATDNGAFRTRNQGNSWILPNNIIDSESGVALTTSEIFSAAASEKNDIWLGSGDGLAKLRETGFWRGEWKIYFASLPVGSANETYCYPNPFSPKLEVLKIKYSTGGVGKKITIRIFDFAMNIVKTVIQNVDRIKTLDDAPEKWDGRDGNGNVVPNGVYFYRIDFDNDDPAFGKIIVLQ